MSQRSFISRIWKILKQPRLKAQYSVKRPIVSSQEMVEKMAANSSGVQSVSAHSMIEWFVMVTEGKPNRELFSVYQWAMRYVFTKLYLKQFSFSGIHCVNVCVFHQVSKGRRPILDAAVKQVMCVGGSFIMSCCVFSFSAWSVWVEINITFLFSEWV